MKIIIALLLLSCTGFAQNPEIKSAPVNVINWFNIRYYFVTDSTRMVTTDSNMYVWDERLNKWQPSIIMNGRKIGRVEYSDMYEFYMPMCVLRDVATGDTVNLSAIAPKYWAGNGLTRAAFHESTVALVDEDEIVYYNANEHEVMGRRDGFIFGPNTMYLTENSLYVVNGWRVEVFDRSSGTRRLLDFGITEESTVTRQNGARSGRWLIGSTLNAITAIDIVADTFKYLYIKHPNDGKVLSYYVFDGKVYTSWWLDTITTYIEETDIETGESRTICNIPSWYGTGSFSCIINHVDSEMILLSDRQGGLYRYDLSSQALAWCGDGIYEYAPRAIAIYKDSMFLGGEAYLFRMSGGDVTLHHPVFPLFDVTEMSFFKDTLLMVTLPGDFRFLQAQTLSNTGDARLWLAHTISFFIKDDTVLLASDPTSVFGYDGSPVMYMPCEGCRIVDAGTMLIAGDSQGELRTFTYADRSLGEINIRIKDTEKLVAATTGGEVLVVQEASTVRSIDASTGGYTWESPDTVDYINKVSFGEYEFISLSNGQLVDPLTGEVALQIGNNVTKAVMFQDTCFLFYNNGKAVKAWMDRSTGVDRMNQDKNHVIDLYPNPGNGFVRIAGLPHASGEHNIVLYDRLGRNVYTRRLTGTSESAGFDATALEPGFYILFVYDRSGALIHRKAFYRSI